MLRYLKFIVTAFLVLMAVGYANANGPVPGLNKLEPIHTEQYNKAQLAVPKLHISLESTPKLTDIPSLKSEFAPQTDFFADNTNSISEGLTQYASLPVPNSVIKTNVESLYEKHGFNKAVENSLYFYTKKFKEKELPQELIFLPLIESGFNLHAYSPKKAAGLWQFIPGTAKRYGLKINWWVDERRDQIKATIAASEYL